MIIQSITFNMNIIINATILNESDITGLGVYTTNVLMRLIPLLQQDNDICKIIVIGDDAKIAAGSVVIHDVPLVVIVGGNPARELRKSGNDNPENNSA